MDGEGMPTSLAACQSVIRRFGPRRAGVLAATLLLAAACSASSTSSQPSPTSTPTSTPSAQSSASRTFQVATPDGQVSVSLDGQLPPNWPSDFPIPPSATPAGSGSLGGSTSTGHVAVFSTTTPAPAVFSFYTSNRNLTTTGSKSAGAGATYVGSMKVTAPYTGSVTVAGRNDGTYILVVLSVPAASPSS
jgi:hypothetical protein